MTVADLTAFAADLKAITPPSGQPTSAVTTTFQTLQSDASAVLASGTFTSAQQTQIVNDVGAVLTSEGATAAQASKASTDLQTIVTASGLNSTDVAQIDSDLKAVQTDLARTQLDDDLDLDGNLGFDHDLELDRDPATGPDEPGRWVPPEPGDGSRFVRSSGDWGWRPAEHGICQPDDRGRRWPYRHVTRWRTGALHNARTAIDRWLVVNEQLNDLLRHASARRATPDKTDSATWTPEEWAGWHYL